MPRARTPLAKAILTGADRKNPQRYRGRTGPVLSGRTIGRAPTYLSGAARTAWCEFAAELPWLVHEDRPILELACELRGRLADSGGEVTAAMLGAYRSALVSLGATPVDRNKISYGHEEELNDPFAEFTRSIHA